MRVSRDFSGLGAFFCNFLKAPWISEIFGLLIHIGTAALDNSVFRRL